MADIDDELLALAGDASSDEDDEIPMAISSKESPDGNATVKDGAKKSAGRKTTRRQNDSEEEGEAYVTTRLPDLILSNAYSLIVPLAILLQIP